MTCTRFGEVDVAAFVVDPRAEAWADFRIHHPGCPDCAREVAPVADLITALRGSDDAGRAHPSADQLVALTSEPGRLPAEELERIERHLTGCAPCRTELAVLERFELAPHASGRRPFFSPARLALAAALLLTLSLPAIYYWRAGFDRGTEPPSEAPQLARVEQRAEPVVETDVPPSPVVEPAATLPEAAPEPAPKPVPTEAPQSAPKAEPVSPPAPSTRAPEAPAREPARPIEIAALLPAEAPRYAPRALAGAEVRRIGGVARSTGGDAPAPQVIAPADLGRTSRESPTLYWFLPETSSFPVEVTLVDPQRAEPLLEKTLAAPVAGGLHAIRLGEHGVRLAPGVDYQWFVALVVDPEKRSNDVVSGGSIHRESPPRLDAVPPERLAHAYAEAGLWYDAFDQLSTWLAAEPRAAILHAHRAALLEQVGLDEVARIERER